MANASRSECPPLSLVLLIHRIAVASPVLHLKIACIGFGPMNANDVHILFLVEGNYHPLWMQRVILPSEVFCEVGITLPVGPSVSVVEPRVPIKLRSAIPRESPMRQRVSVGVPNHFVCRICISGEISLPRRIAPRSFGIPMPRLYEEICILPVSNDSPSRRQDFLDLVGTKENIGRIAGHAVDCRT